jgi:hypothetical protein
MRLEDFRSSVDSHVKSIALREMCALKALFTNVMGADLLPAEASMVVVLCLMLKAHGTGALERANVLRVVLPPVLKRLTDSIGYGYMKAPLRLLTHVLAIVEDLRRAKWASP